MKLELPAAAWELEQEADPSGTITASKLYAAVGEAAFIGVRELKQSPACEVLKGVTDAEVPALVKQMFGTQDLQVTGKLVKLATQSIYAELAVPNKNMTLYLICRDPRVVLITVTGGRPMGELKTVIERITSPLAQAPGNSTRQ
jgi:hypothetical protein